MYTLMDTAHTLGIITCAYGTLTVRQQTCDFSPVHSKSTHSMREYTSLIPRSSTPAVFDIILYVIKTGGVEE